MPYATKEGTFRGGVANKLVNQALELSNSSEVDAIGHCMGAAIALALRMGAAQGSIHELLDTLWELALQQPRKQKDTN